MRSHRSTHDYPDAPPINPDVLADRLAYAKTHPYPATKTARPTCARCRSAVFARVIHTFGVPVYESICSGGHSEYLGRFRSDGRFSVAA